MSLSEQHVLDCMIGYPYSNGCNGGFQGDAFGFAFSDNTLGSTAFVRQFGLDNETDYPYTGAVGTCKFPSFAQGASGANGEGWVELTANEAALQAAVANVGPISVLIDASSSFESYSGGTISDTL